MLTTLTENHDPLPLDIKLRSIDVAIKMMKERQVTRKYSMSCSRLFWATATIVQGVTDGYLDMDYEVNADTRGWCNLFVAEYQLFMRGENYEWPRWWNCGGDVFYDERIIALTAFKQHIIAQAGDTSGVDACYPNNKSGVEIE